MEKTGLRETGPSPSAMALKLRSLERNGARHTGSHGAELVRWSPVQARGEIQERKKTSTPSPSSVLSALALPCVPKSEPRVLFCMFLVQFLQGQFPDWIPVQRKGGIGRDPCLWGVIPYTCAFTIPLSFPPFPSPSFLPFPLSLSLSFWRQFFCVSFTVLELCRPGCWPWVHRSTSFPSAGSVNSWASERDRGRGWEEKVLGSGRGMSKGNGANMIKIHYMSEVIKE